MVVAAPPRCATTAYADAVVTGQVVAGRLVRLACERHLRDLDLGGLRGLTFDEDAAQRVVDFFERFLTLTEGEHDGRPFVLAPFQKFILGCLFGWKGDDGFRRFRTGYVEIGKGNGKSPLAAGIGLYGLVGDREAAAEIYSAAVTREQAKILFRDAENMVKASHYLSQRVDQRVNNLAVLSTSSFFRPVSSEKRGLDGKRVHMGLIDELHEHASSIAADKMRAGTKGRRQALIFEITNSGYDRLSVCWQHHDYSRQVLEGTIENDSWFAYVCQLDEGDEWDDEAVWPKANPNLGVSISHKYLREQVAEAKGMPSKQNIVKRLNLCVWTEQAERWLDMAQWDACDEPVDREALLGQPCYAALDLSSTTDLTAFVATFPDEGGGFDVLCQFFLPADGIAKRAERDHVPYEMWAKQGFLTLTPGSIVDYDIVRDAVVLFGAEYQTREIPFDAWNATQLATQLSNAGATVVAIPQGYSHLSEPSKKLEALLASKQLRHGNNPILRWMASQVAVEHGPNASIRPSKKHSTGRIDGIVALVMALSRAMVHGDAAGSVYEERGLLAL